ncbi:MAG: hypothetical protein EOM20_18705 [Spartobacteria bacterium]|nr:hypothetical protein [Spartobacteria bacterium]
MKALNRVRLHILAGLLIVTLSSGCGLLGGKETVQKGMMDGYAYTLSAERALSEAKVYMRQRGFQNKYDLSSGIAYDKGKYWSVCFEPRSGFFRHCVEIDK